MSTALVTGSAGFVGRHFVRRLRDEGWEITEVDVANTFESWDCRDWFTWHLGARPPVQRFDLVIHCAAVVGGRAMIEGDPMSLAVNLEIDSAMFRWAARARPGRVVYMSSSAAYPVWMQTDALAERVKPRLEESDLILPPVEGIGIDAPDGTYGWAKVNGEYLATFLREAGVPVTVIRPFSGYGTDQSLDYPFPAFIDRALHDRVPFEIWGNGQQVRDWIHIDDIVSLTLAAVSEEEDGPLNACSGVGVSFQKLAQMVLEERWRPFGEHQIRTETLHDKPSGVRYRVGDPTLSRKIWTPKITLEEGILRALEGRQ